MPTTEKKKLRLILQEQWLADGERLKALLGGEGLSGHLGATLDGRSILPYRPSSSVAGLNVDHSLLPIPTEAIRNMRFHGDEWLHDPAVRGWVYGRSADTRAFSWADHMAAAGPEAWYVYTDRRMAVVVDSAVRTQRDEHADSVAEQQESEQSGGFGRLLGKARSAASAISGAAESVKGRAKASVVTLWECPVSEIVNSRLVPKGRTAQGYDVMVQEFHDGSVLEIRADSA